MKYYKRFTKNYKQEEKANKLMGFEVDVNPRKESKNERTKNIFNIATTTTPVDLFALVD
jgi:hypothetical protein